MADRLLRLHPEDYAYMKDLCKGNECITKVAGFMFIPMEDKMTDKPKAKMTRAQAVKIFEKYHIYGDVNDTVDFYIEAGMLEVVDVEEDKSVVHFNEPNILLQTHADKGLQLYVHGNLVYQHNK